MICKAYLISAGNPVLVSVLSVVDGLAKYGVCIPVVL